MTPSVYVTHLGFSYRCLHYAFYLVECCYQAKDSELVWELVVSLSNYQTCRGRKLLLRGLVIIIRPF